MSSWVHNLTQQHAVISVRREPRPERSVIAYSNQKALRDLLAEPSTLSSLPNNSYESAYHTIV